MAPGNPREQAVRVQMFNSKTGTCLCFLREVVGELRKEIMKGLLKGDPVCGLGVVK
jgi:hypothetical protein